MMAVLHLASSHKMDWRIRLTAIATALSTARETGCQELQTIECQVGVNGFDEASFLANEWSLAAGSDDAGFRSELVLHSGDDSINQGDIAINDPALHARYCGSTDYVRGLLDFYPGQLRGMLV